VRDGRISSEIHFTRLLSQGLVKCSDDFPDTVRQDRCSHLQKATEVATTKSRKRDVSARYSASQEAPSLPPSKFCVEFGGGALKERWG